METCLEDLWELIRNPISKIIEKKDDLSAKRETLAEKCDAAEKTDRLVKEFFNDLEESFTAPTSFFYILIILLLYHVDWPFSVYLSGSVEKIFAVKSNDKNVTYLSLFS